MKYMPKELKPKKIKGRITTLMAAPYKESMVYIRQIDEDIFEYSLVFNKQIYSNYMVFTLPEGKKKMTKYQIQCGMNMLLAGAQATIDTLRGDKLEEKDKQLVKDFEQVDKILN
jgi:hypothetical protein